MDGGDHNPIAFDALFLRILRGRGGQGREQTERQKGAASQNKLLHIEISVHFVCWSP
jgi:hypothetical protein